MSTFPADGNRFIKMSFTGCFTYRYTIESGRLKFLGEEQWTNPFNVSSDSKYLNWFKEESGNMYDEYNPLHHLIVCDELIDVISIKEPTVEWIEEPVER